VSGSVWARTSGWIMGWVPDTYQRSPRLSLVAPPRSTQLLCLLVALLVLASLPGCSPVFGCWRGGSIFAFLGSFGFASRWGP
jgi:hypothetical protein